MFASSVRKWSVWTQFMKPSLPHWRCIHTLEEVNGFLERERERENLTDFRQSTLTMTSNNGYFSQDSIHHQDILGLW